MIVPGVEPAITLNCGTTEKPGGGVAPAYPAVVSVISITFVGTISLTTSRKLLTVNLTFPRFTSDCEMRPPNIAQAPVGTELSQCITDAHGDQHRLNAGQARGQYGLAAHLGHDPRRAFVDVGEFAGLGVSHVVVNEFPRLEGDALAELPDRH